MGHTSPKLREYACWIAKSRIYSYQQHGKKCEATAHPGWYYVYPSDLTGAMPLKRDQWYLTKGGSIVSAGQHGFTDNATTPQKLQFWMVRDNTKLTNEINDGTALYYDKDLEIIDRKGREDLNIVGPYTGDMGKTCPHCDEIIFKEDW